MTSSLLRASLPLLIVAVTAVAVMLCIAIRRNHRLTAVISVIGLAMAFVSLWPASSVAPLQVTSLLVIDRYALLYMGFLLVAAMALILLAFPYMENRSEQKEEFYLLLILATLGSMILTASCHMASLFLGLELLSISLYALIAYPRTQALPLEAGIKYLVLAASSSAFLLFGLALLYIAEGNMDFRRMTPPAPGSGGGFAYLAGTVLVITGIGFKLAVVPFHLWTPDVYEGAPVPVTGFVATVSKAGVFAFLLRWLRTTGSDPVTLVLAIIAIASMLVGNLLALRQTNIKRLLAYSSIAHMGYFLVAAVVGGILGRTAATYYLAAYVTTILGAFGCLTVLSSATPREEQTFDDIRGLFWRRPQIASVFTAMLLSLAGIPLTAGFLGKFYVLTAGASAAAWTLILVLIASSTIGLVYYLRVIVAMFTESEGSVEEDQRTMPGITPGIVLCVLVFGLLLLGVYPGPLWNGIQSAAAALQ